MAVDWVTQFLRRDGVPSWQADPGVARIYVASTGAVPGGDLSMTDETFGAVDIGSVVQGITDHPDQTFVKVDVAGLYDIITYVQFPTDVDLEDGGQISLSVSAYQDPGPTSVGIMSLQYFKPYTAGMTWIATKELVWLRAGTYVGLSAYAYSPAGGMEVPTEIPYAEMMVLRVQSA